MYIIVAGVNKSFGDNLSIIIHLSGAETWSSEPRQSRNGVIEGGVFAESSRHPFLNWDFRYYRFDAVWIDANGDYKDSRGDSKWIHAK